MPSKPSEAAIKVARDAQGVSVKQAAIIIDAALESARDEAYERAAVSLEGLLMTQEERESAAGAGSRVALRAAIAQCRTLKSEGK